MSRHRKPHIARPSPAGRREVCPALLTGAALLLLAPHPAAAQGEEGEARPDPQVADAAETGPSTHITGFRNVTWGTSEAELVRRLGEPEERRVLENGLRMLAYRDTLVGHPSVLLFGLIEDGGVVKAQEVIDAEGGDACIATIRDIHRRIDLQYPLIRPAEQAKNNTPHTVCDAAPEGLAYWHRQWRDDTTGSTITVSLASGSDAVDLIYESRQFREWVDPTGEGPVEVLEDEGAPSDVLEARP